MRNDPLVVKYNNLYMNNYSKNMRIATRNTNLATVSGVYSPMRISGNSVCYKRFLGDIDG